MGQYKDRRLFAYVGYKYVSLYTLFLNDKNTPQYRKDMHEFRDVLKVGTRNELVLSN